MPASIDTTGNADVTEALATFFASVPDGSTIEFPAGATYRVEGTLLFTNRNSLTLKGNGARIVATTDGSGVAPPPSLRHRWPRHRAHIMFVGGSNITVRRLTLVGANRNAGPAPDAYVEALEAQHAFEFSGVKGALLDSVRATDLYGDFVYLGANGSTWATNITVRRSHFERNGRQGIAITAAQNVLVEGNYIGRVRRSAIDIEPSTAAGGARHVTFRNNTFGYARLNFLASTGQAGVVDDITIDGNTLDGMYLEINVTPPANSRRSNIRIVNNASNGAYGSPIAVMRFTRIDSLEVRGNVQPLVTRRMMTGVSVLESCAVVVIGNQFPGGVREADIQPAVCP